MFCFANDDIEAIKLTFIAHKWLVVGKKKS